MELMLLMEMSVNCIRLVLNKNESIYIFLLFSAQNFPMTIWLFVKQIFLKKLKQKEMVSERKIGEKQPAIFGKKF